LIDFVRGRRTSTRHSQSLSLAGPRRRLRCGSAFK
jgi:hypothetical protein